MKLAICPGHYPDKPGAKNSKYDIYEHFVAEHLANKVKEILEGNGHTVKIYTGTLKKKVSYINRGKFDAAFDLHFNADPETEDTDDTKGYGCCVLYYPGNETRKEQAAKMSKVISTELETRDLGAIEGYYWGGDNPGTVPDYFLAKTKCAAFILEPGFIDNNSFAERFLLSMKGINVVAEAVAKGIEEGLA